MRKMKKILQKQLSSGVIQVVRPELGGCQSQVRRQCHSHCLLSCYLSKTYFITMNDVLFFNMLLKMSNSLPVPKNLLKLFYSFLHEFHFPPYNLHCTCKMIHFCNSTYFAFVSLCISYTNYFTTFMTLLSLLTCFVGIF